MEWILIVLGCIVISGACMLFFTKITYTHSLKIGKDPIPSAGSYRKHTVEERETLETQRRAKLAKEAVRSGVIAGLVWFVTIPMMIIGIIIMLIGKLIKKVSIDPEDKEFVSAKEFRKAEEVVAKWRMQEADQFEKELNA